ncbi:hypothetical protein GB937_003468 [Aspergillus fischeri]|nr:hypothetical protein GB937_003468 [Aspergillus fischeri]
MARDYDVGATATTATVIDASRLYCNGKKSEEWTKTIKLASDIADKWQPIEEVLLWSLAMDQSKDLSEPTLGSR